MKMKMKKKLDVEESESDSDSNLSDEELREAFAKGLIKPGLNAVIETEKKERTNNVTLLKLKTDEIKLKLPWIERLDIINTPAPLAPELALQMQEQEERRAKQAKGNRKLPQYKPGEDPVLNDFKRETMFHRQAQSAVINGISRIKKLGISAIRPDDYFAEMAKSDDHMHKVRENLARKQLAAQRSEKVRQLRQQRKVGKQMQIEATLKKHAEKRKMLEEVKKYRKGMRKDLDFLDDKKKPMPNRNKNNYNSSNNSIRDKRMNNKQKSKNAKFGFGGKKRGMKKNTRESAADISEYRRPHKEGVKNGRVNKSNRLGKNRRVQMKAKRK